MATRINAFFACALAAILAAACAPAPINVNLKIVNGPGDKDEEEEKKEELVPYTPEWERHIADHEGGHAVAGAYLFGPASILNIRVRTVSGKKGINYAGLTNVATGNTFESKDDVLRAVSMYLASRAAEIRVRGGARTSTVSDIQTASERAWAICLSYGFCGTLLVTTKEQAPDWMRETVRQFVDVQASTCADAIIAANLGLVKAIGDALVSKGPKDDERLIDNAEFRQILAANPLRQAVSDPKNPLPSFCVMRQ